MDGSASAAKKGPPERVGPYRIEKRLGAGGMGEVYRAWDERLERPVAVKQMLDSIAAEPKIQERFRREARSAARLNHRAIVRVYDLVESEDGDWIIMELVEGRSLKRQLRETPMSTGAVLRLARDIAEGLAAAHAEDIVHRDLKIENVMITEAGRAKILDFGLAKNLAPDSPESTLSLLGAVMGTVRTMSPEQAQGLPLDHRSDLFSFGILLFETVTGRSPFKGSNEVKTLKHICRKRHPSVRTLNPAVPEPMARLIDRLLEKKVEDRPQSAKEVAAELRDMKTSAAATPQDKSGFFDKTLVVTEIANHDTLLAEIESTGAYADLGEARLYKIFARHDRLLRDVLADCGGFEIDRTDCFQLFFDFPARALNFALLYHRKLTELSREVGLRFRSRTAIHVGSLYLQENSADDVSRGAKPHEAAGSALLAATRLAAFAQPGQILLTGDVCERARQGLDEEIATTLRFVAHGPLPCGTAGELEVFEVSLANAAPLLPPRKIPRWSSGHEMPAIERLSASSVSAAPSASRIEASAPSAEVPFQARKAIGNWWIVAIAFVLGMGLTYLGMRYSTPPSGPIVQEILPPSVAILGFRNLSGPDSDWLDKALSEMLAAELAEAQRSRLIAGESVARLKEKHGEELATDDASDLVEIGRNLEADYLVFGSYERTGEEKGGVLRWHTVLSEVATGKILVEDDIEGSDEELFELVIKAGELLRRHLDRPSASP